MSLRQQVLLFLHLGSQSIKAAMQGKVTMVVFLILFSNNDFKFILKQILENVYVNILMFAVASYNVKSYAKPSNSRSIL